MRQTILNHKFANHIEEGDINEEYNEIFLFIDSDNLAPELLEFARENEISEPYICMNLIDGTYCLVDETGYNCDRNYSIHNMRSIDLDNLVEMDELLNSYVTECLSAAITRGEW
jgi:hypothetical protein